LTPALAPRVLERADAGDARSDPPMVLVQRLPQRLDVGDALCAGLDDADVAHAWNGIAK
jgi:hypothetical protein